jgi:hypothetical protein
MRGMDPQRDDYDDGPVRRPLTPAQWMLLTVGAIMGGAVVGALLLWMGLFLYVMWSGGPKD